MRAVLQRVSSASVTIGADVIAAIQHGLLVLVAVEAGDEAGDNEWLSGPVTLLLDTKARE